MIHKTLYEILGVAVDATAAQIKRAYRKHAKKSHPDRGGDPEKFQEATHAYEVLSDPARRERYDKTGQGGDPEQVEAMQKQVAMLAQIILEVIRNNPIGCNPVAAARDVLTAKMEQLKRVAQMDREQAQRLRHIASNVLKRGEGDNVVAAVLESHANGGDTHAAQLVVELEGLAQILKMLDDYAWKPDGERSQPNFIQIPTGRNWNPRWIT